jgi:hypothetical protein
MMVGVLLFVGIVILTLAFGAAVSAGLGVLAAWVLMHFGVHVAWYVCSAAIFLLGCIFKASPQ